MHTACDSCSLHKTATQIVRPRGPVSAPVVLVGEAPGADEDAQGVPFIGPAGQRLEQILRTVGGIFADVGKPDSGPLICNAVQCRPPGNRTPTPREIKACVATHVHKVLTAHPRKLVVALGSTAWKFLSPHAWERDIPHPSIRTINGIISEHPAYGHVMATFHPSAALRSEVYHQPLVDALFRAKQFLEGHVFRPKYEVDYIDTLARANQAIHAIPDGSDVYLDVETTGLNPLKDALTMFAIRVKGHSVVHVINWAKIYRELPQGALSTMRVFLIQLFQRCRLHNQNWKFDAKFLYRTFHHRVFLDGWWGDPMVKHFLIDENSGHGLKSRAALDLGALDWDGAMHQRLQAKPTDDTNDWLPFPITLGQGKNRRSLLRWIRGPELAEYAAADVVMTDHLDTMYDSQMEEECVQHTYWRITRPIISMLARAELRGIQIDREGLQQYREELVAQLHWCNQQWERIKPGFNFNSDAQIRHLLFDQLRLPQDPELERTDTGKISIASDNLHHLARVTDNEVARQWIRILLRSRVVHKLLNTYVIPFGQQLDEYGILRGSFIICPSAEHWRGGDDAKGGTVTGRLSSANPNLQNIPDIMRGLFIARDGYQLLDADISQTEVRGWALLSDDPALLQVVASEDVHCGMARMIWPELANCSDQEIKTQHAAKRKIAKTIVFAAIYQASPGRLAIQAGISVEDAKKLIVLLQERFTRGWRWIQEVQTFVQKHGYIASYFGRRRRLPDVWNGNEGVRARTLRQAVNSPVQGLGADVCYLAGIGGLRWLQERGFHTGEVDSPVCELLTVHDSWLFEVREDLVPHIAPHWAEVLTQTYKTSSGADVRFPADVKLGRRWKDQWEDLPIPSVEALRAHINKACALAETTA